MDDGFMDDGGRFFGGVILPPLVTYLRFHVAF